MAKILTFRTTESHITSEWCEVAEALSKRLAESFNALGYEADFEACQWPGNDAWEFLASGHGLEFVVTLCPYKFFPNRWFVTLYDTHNKPLNRPDIESFAEPILESVAKSLPGASAFRWHADSSTLHDV